MALTTQRAHQPERVPRGSAPGSRGTRAGWLRRVARSEGFAGYAFLLPWLLGLLLITLGPMLASLYLSLTDYDLLSAPEFVGLDNYIEMFTADADFYDAAMVTIRYVVISVPLQLALALGVALLLNRGLRGLAFYRSVFYVPSLVGASVAIAVLWRQMFGADGLINQLLGLVGIEGQSWIGHPDTVLWTLIILNIWMFGAPMVIFLAALRQVPQVLYEAAHVDGASKLRRFWHVTVPVITPIIFFNLVLQTIASFQAFTQAYVISGGTGGPINSTLFYTLYLYQEGFAHLSMGYASALAWVLLVVVAGVTFLNFWASRYWVHYADN